MKCECCRWWRVKSDVMGICDNTKTDTQVRMLNPELIARYFAKGDNDSERKSNAEEIHNSIRFHKDFGCVNFERAE